MIEYLGAGFVIGVIVGYASAFLIFNVEFKKMVEYVKKLDAGR